MNRPQKNLPLQPGATHDLGHVAPLLHEDATIDVTSTGTAPLVVSGVEIAGDYRSDFEFGQGPSNSPLATGDATSFVVRFRPQVARVPSDPSAWHRTALVTSTPTSGPTFPTRPI